MSRSRILFSLQEKVCKASSRGAEGEAIPCLRRLLRFARNDTALRIHAAALMILIGLTPGCADYMARMTVNNMKPIFEDMHSTTNANRDYETVRDAMPNMLIQMDGFIETSPRNRYLLASAAEANIGYAFLFVEDTDRERAKGIYFKGREYALRNLKLNRTFEQGLSQNDIEVFKRGLKTIHKRDIAALYFAVNGWLSWINLAHGDNPEVLNDLPKVEAMMDRLLELDDTFYYGGPHALFAVYCISRPEMFGGRSDESQFHFREAFEISQSKYLLWHYLYARYYAIQLKDRELFEKTLNGIVSAPDDLLPEQAFVNAAVKQKAKDLLAHADDYFK